MHAKGTWHLELRITKRVVHESSRAVRMTPGSIRRFPIYWIVLSTFWRVGNQSSDSVLESVNTAGIFRGTIVVNCVFTLVLYASLWRYLEGPQGMDILI